MLTTFKNCLKIYPRFVLWSINFFFGMIVCSVDRLFYFLLFSKKTEYVRKGQCQSSGQCCQAIGLKINIKWLQKDGFIRWLTGYYRCFHNFEFLEMQKNKDMMVFSCEHLRDNKCSIYPFRPKLCREFPQTPLFGKTALHKGCGFWFFKRGQGSSFNERLR